MNVQLGHLTLAAALATVVATGFAQQPGKVGVPLQDSKEEIHARLASLAQEINALRARFGSERQIAELMAQYSDLSASLGGDDPATLFGSTPHLPLLPPAPIAPTACDGIVPLTSTFPGTSGPITPPTTAPGSVFTTVVSGVGGFLWDVNLTTDITHTSSGQLDITLESPAGTIITVTTDNGGNADNVFSGTLWDDNVNAPATDFAYANLVAATPLSPEGRLAAFRGENPSGTWRLTIQDDSFGQTGTLNSWSLDVSTLVSAPVTATTSFTRSPNLAIVDQTTVSDTIAVSIPGTNVNKVTLYVEIQHTFADDMDFTLTSPAGTVVKVSTDNGDEFDDVFNGTLFDNDVLDTVTDHSYSDFLVVPLLSPEGSFDNFLGQDPNGTWTLSIADDEAVDVGALVRWDLNITVAHVPSPSGVTNFAGTSGAIPDLLPPIPAATVFTATVSGMDTYLLDVDLTTAITHTAGADIDMTLTSPAGTIVTITTDNGGTADDVFNGTLWDDNANDPATDYGYASSTTATPLSPEGRLAAFRGEDPNGTWTLTIQDDALADNGAVNSWSLVVSTLVSAPVASPANFTASPGLPIPDPGTVTDTQIVSGIGTSLENLTLYVEITHAFAGDLDISLTSGAGTVVTVTTDNGGSNDDVFNGTLFDPQALDPVTNHVYVNLTVATPLSPEGSFDNFVGQNPNGTWTLTVTDDGGGDVGALARWDLDFRTCAAGTPFTAYCFGDGSGMPCPCGNAGATGNGCASSVNAAGANLAGSGVASISADTFVLTGSGMPTTSTGLYYQGTAQVTGGAGIAFGDGLRCAGGTVTRLGTKTSVSGASSYPAVGDTPISVKGMNVAGNVRFYQCWYRNAVAFCTPFTFNLTNGLRTTWIQ